MNRFIAWISRIFLNGGGGGGVEKKGSVVCSFT